MPTYPIQLRNDSTENFTAKNPTPRAAEVCVTVDFVDGAPVTPPPFKIGNGQTPWVDLPYQGGGAGSTGPEGPAGPAGPAGPKGDAGPAGADGTDGATGPTGADGSVGPEGPAGPAGPKGDAGPAGADGTDGATGPTGADGSVGPEGPAGAAGPKGDAGPAGADGTDGATGPTGADGSVGPEGPKGADGLAGSSGPAGSKGDTGPAGAAGVSPTIIENAGNDDTTYKIDITDANGTITTPNLKGADGTGGGGGSIGGIPSGGVDGEVLTTDSTVDGGLVWRSSQMPTGSQVLLTNTLDGYLPMNAELYDKTEKARLFSVIGTSYGASEDGTKFAVPSRPPEPMGAIGEVFTPIDFYTNTLTLTKENGVTWCQGTDGPYLYVWSNSATKHFYIPLSDPTNVTEYDSKISNLLYSQMKYAKNNVLYCIFVTGGGENYSSCGTVRTRVSNAGTKWDVFTPIPSNIVSGMDVDYETGDIWTLIASVNNGPVPYSRRGIWKYDNATGVYENVFDFESMFWLTSLAISYTGMTCLACCFDPIKKLLYFQVVRPNALTQYENLLSSAFVCVYDTVNKTIKIGAQISILAIMYKMFMVNGKCYAHQVNGSPLLYINEDGFISNAYSAPFPAIPSKLSSSSLNMETITYSPSGEGYWLSNVSSTTIPFVVQKLQSSLGPVQKDAYWHIKD